MIFPHSLIDAALKSMKCGADCPVCTANCDAHSIGSNHHVHSFLYSKLRSGGGTHTIKVTHEWDESDDNDAPKRLA